MRIDGSREASFGRGDRRPAATATAVESSSRALTVIAGSAPREPGSQPRGNAAFLAHLIATTTQAPQTRARRRAEPAEVLAAYRAAAALVG
jgi:hypothetical protein